MVVKKRETKHKTMKNSSVEKPDGNVVLADIGRIINSSLFVEDVFQQIAGQVKLIIPSDRFRINLVEKSTEQLRIVFVSGINVPARPVGRRFNTEGSIPLGSLVTAHVQVVQGLREEEFAALYPRMMAVYERGLRSYLMVPILFNKAVVGTIGIQSKKPNAYSDHDAQLAERFALQVAGALSNAKLYADLALAEEQQRRLAEENAALAEIGRIISSSAEISDVYSQFGEVVNKLLPSERITISLADMSRNKVQTAYEWGIAIPGGEPGNIFRSPSTATLKVIQADGPVVCGANGVSRSIQRISKKESGIQSFIAVPMRSSNEITGVVLIHSLHSNVYEDRHVRLLSTIADQISGAIATSQLYARATKSEANLRNSENKLRSLFESTASGILTIDDQGAIESLNQAAEEIFGYPTGELIGQNVSVLIPAPFRAGQGSHLSNYLSAGQSVVIVSDRELSGLRKDGSVFPIELVVNHMEVNGQRYFSGVVRDISERVRAQEETRLLAAIVDSVDDAIIANDPSRNINVWNKGAEDLYGYSASEAIGKTFDFINPPQFRDLQATRSLAVLSGQRWPIYDTEKISEDGQLMAVMSSTSPIFDRSGEVIGAVSVQRDITERKEAEEKMRRLATIVESANEPIIALNTDRRITVWNAAAESLYGYCSDEVIGKVVDFLFPPHLQGVHYENAKIINRAERIQVYETQILTKIGKIVEVESSGSPILDQLGTVVGAVGLHRDITENNWPSENLGNQKNDSTINS